MHSTVPRVQGGRQNFTVALYNMGFAKLSRRNSLNNGAVLSTYPSAPADLLGNDRFVTHA